jgi:peptidoglycan hydrolase-like protein with peptidoglycan-binding domain
VVPRGNGSGSFQVQFPTRYAGSLKASVGVHVGPGDVASAHTQTIQFVHTDISPGTSGASVRLLQSELNGLHYAVPLNGAFEEATERALIAFRKVTGMNRVGEAGAEVFRKLAHGEGGFPVRYPHDGRHVEANLTKQVLAEIEPGGRVHAIYTMSSGKPSTPTVIGHFYVYSKTPGINSEGMVDSNYFIRGYAIHGYAEVPTYAASHGCLRVPIPDAAAIYAWVREGTPVDVYNESGGGSTHVRSNAGP